jgi:hypothetical protein
MLVLAGALDRYDICRLSSVIIADCTAVPIIFSAIFGVG